MEDVCQRTPSDLHLSEKALFPWDMYSRGWAYYTVLLKGLSQMWLYMLGNYALPASYRPSYNPDYRSLRLPSSHTGISGDSLNQARRSFNSVEDLLSSLRKYSEDYFSKNAPAVLHTILEFVCLAYSSNAELRRHIKNINAKYWFRFGDSDREISLEIKNAGMRVFPGNTDLPDISLKFRDGEVMKKLFMSEKPDILDLILKQDVAVDGNLMYLLKFIYLMNHLQKKLLGSV